MTLIPAAEALATLDRIEADIAALRRSLSAPQQVDEADDDSWPTFPDDPDLISTEEAAKRACRGQDAVREWCVRYGIGQIYHNRYRVSVRRLRQHLAKSRE